MQTPPNDDSFIHDEAVRLREINRLAKANARASIDKWLYRCADVAQRLSDDPEQFNLEMSDPSMKHVITTEKGFDLRTLMRLPDFGSLHKTLEYHVKLHQSSFPFEVQVDGLPGTGRDPYEPAFVLVARMPQ